MIYGINEKMAEVLERAIDMETGEVMDQDALNAYEDMALKKEEIVENVGLWIKNLDSESSAIKAEIDSLKERCDAKKRKSEWLKSYLQDVLAGEKYESARLKISYRRSSKVNDDVNIEDLPEDYIRTKVTREIDRVSLTKALKNGEEITGARLIETVSMQIK